jgi:tetratricopeptide (TPR) repeat protein
VVRRFLLVSPHDSLLRRTLFSLLEALGRNDVLEAEIRKARQDPFADVALLADGASALRRIGREDAARRAFGELMERAPTVPYARAYAGDRLRSEGLFDEAAMAYGVLETLLPDDPAVGLRLGLAHAGAGRLDVATRILDRVARTGGRTGDEDYGDLASMTAAVLIAEAIASAGDEGSALLKRRLIETPLPDAAGIVLVRAPPSDAPIEPRLVRGGGPGEGSPPDLAAPSIGLYAFRLERGDDDVHIRVSQQDVLPPTRPTVVRVDFLPIDANQRAGSVAHREVTLGPDGKAAEIHHRNGELR